MVPVGCCRHDHRRPDRPDRDSAMGEAGSPLQRTRPASVGHVVSGRRSAVKPVSRQCDAVDWRQVRPCHGPADDELAATVYESVVSQRAGTPTESRCNPATVAEAEIRMPRALSPITVKGRRYRLARAPRDVPPGGQIEGCAPVPVAGDVAHIEPRCVEKCADVIPGEEPPPSLVGNPALAIQAPS